VRRRKAAGEDFAAACRARVANYSYQRATAGLLAACERVARRSALKRPPAVVQ
jgi:hypothetical protein